MLTADITGQDLAYWVARANTQGSPQEHNILRRHYGDGTPTHEPCDEASMRTFAWPQSAATRCRRVRRGSNQEKKRDLLRYRG